MRLWAELNFNYIVRCIIKAGDNLIHFLCVKIEKTDVAVLILMNYDYFLSGTCHLNDIPDGLWCSVTGCVNIVKCTLWENLTDVNDILILGRRFLIAIAVPHRIDKFGVREAFIILLQMAYLAGAD